MSRPFKRKMDMIPRTLPPMDLRVPMSRVFEMTVVWRIERMRTPAMRITKKRMNPMMRRSSQTARRKFRRLSSQVFTRNRLPISFFSARRPSARRRGFVRAFLVRGSAGRLEDARDRVAEAALHRHRAHDRHRVSLGEPLRQFSRSCRSCFSRSRSAAGSCFRRYGRIISIPSAISSGVRIPSSAARTSGAWSKESSRMLMLVTLSGCCMNCWTSASGR